MVEYLSVEEAKKRAGLRMVMVGGVPSPWGEAAKGILHVKKIPYAATRMGPEAKAVVAWTGHDSAPIAVHENERPRTGWAEILFLAERLAPTPSLIPASAGERADMIGLAHEICGEEGLGWARRLQLIQMGMQGQGGFAKPIAEYLAPKYGYRGDGEAAATRVVDLLTMLAQRLQRQKEAGCNYLVGKQLTAVDIYLATFMVLFKPLPPEQCEALPMFVEAVATLDDRTRAALAPSLLEHRDRIYAQHLELPVVL